jgi:AcrR family transcriptional regulator
MAAGSANPAPADEVKPRARPQLDADTIVDAALRLAGGGNTEMLTVRSLGKELGADPTAIYRHFRDKEELMKAVLDRVIADAVAAVDASLGWR